MSYTATGAKSMSPAGDVIGKSLVVYNPGISGMAKNAANEIVNKLKSKGYDVELAGVRSAAASSTSGYDIVIAGGPMYRKSKQIYRHILKNTKIAEGSKVRGRHYRHGPV